MKIQEIDIDNHLIIEVPAGKKEALSKAIAAANGYQEFLESSVNKDLTVTQDELERYRNNENPNILLIKYVPNGDNFDISIIDNNPIRNPETETQFALRLASLEVGKLVRRSVKAVQTMQEAAALEAKKNAVENSLNSDLTGLKVL